MKQLRRRQIIQGGGFLGGMLLTKGCASPSASNDSSQIASASPNQNPAQTNAASDTCVLYPTQTEGPYYIDLDLVRQDITEGRAGVPLQLSLTVTDVNGCTPIANAAVDIWHCDAQGNYAGYSTAAEPGSQSGKDRSDRRGPPPSAGSPPLGGQTPITPETYLRGTQITDTKGQVKFATLYPGWYPGRTNHIHVKVHLDSATVLTSQMYFPEEITQVVYAREPYNSRPQKDTTNEQDGIMGGNKEAVLLSLAAQQDGYIGRLIIGVNR
jgi:protocatechuate 3,4-dioxygenase beta subunit